MSNHIKRVLTSILILPLLIIIIYIDKGQYFNLLVIICIFICLEEFYKLVDKKGIPSFRLLGILLGILLPLIFAAKKPDLIPFVLTASILILFLKTLTLSSPLTDSIQRLTSTLFGFVYIPLMLSFLILIRGLRNGRTLIFYLFVIIWLDDIMAYYIGSLFGKHMLCPEISPKKTLEGAIGGLTGSIIATLVYGALCFNEASVFTLFILGMLIGTFGQLGDLSESVLKRWAGVKDSGSLLPGHGGLLDRIDGLIFSTPIFYYFITFILQWK